jgi:hypothetical protein
MQRFWKRKRNVEGKTTQFLKFVYDSRFQFGQKYKLYLLKVLSSLISFLFTIVELSKSSLLTCVTCNFLLFVFFTFKRAKEEILNTFFFSLI